MALRGLIPAANSLSQQYNISVLLAKCPSNTWGLSKCSVRRRSSTLQATACLTEPEPNKEIIRPLGNFHPSLWGDTFVNLLPSVPCSETESYTEELKEKVREMLVASKDNDHVLVEKLSLINLLCRIGVSYHFETEIEQQLDLIFAELVDDANDYDLYTVSKLFRVLRQHGYKASSDMFNKFKDKEGKFADSLKSNVRGILSLYEASQLRAHGEDILEEALDFTTTHLKSFLEETEKSHLTNHISNALTQSFHKGVPRVEARKYIDFYQQEESRNETLLLFAKLDFNRLQLLHRQELSKLTSWWKGLKSAVTVSAYTRDMMVEIYFFAVAHYFEPCYSNARIILTKVGMMQTIFDDMFDAYGTFEELQCFTNAVQRWDISAVDELPDYMKSLYIALLNVVEELDYDMNKEGKSYRAFYTKDAMKGVVRAYMVEAQWLNEGKIPRFDEYLSNGILSAGCILNTTASFVGMGGIVGINELEWVRRLPKLVTAAYTIGRLMDDISSHKREQLRRHVASGVECYMKEYGVSENESIEAIMTIIENAWKDINEELCIMPTKVVSAEICIIVINLARICILLYKENNDGLTKPKYLIRYISRLFVDPIPI